MWLSAEEVSGKERGGQELAVRSQEGLGTRVWEPSPHPPTTPSPHHSALLITVKDQGRGIPADKLQTIFERFQQVDASDSRKKGGTGLGLAICRNIIEQHDGKIWVESTPGEGSTFYVLLPLMLPE